MASVPGPIISFRIGGSELSGAVRPALDQIKREAKTASTQIADDWKRMTAQLRASVAQGSMPEKEVVTARKELVSILEKEISGLRTRNELTRGQLSNLKAQTLELERQTSFLKNGPGLTAGTQSVISSIGGLLSKQTAFLGANLFGVSGGSQLVSGAASAILGGSSFTEKLSEIAVVAPRVALAVGGISAALAGVAIAAAASARSLIAQNQEFKNTASITGLSTKEVQSFGEAAKLLGLDSSTVTMSLSRIQAELGKFIVSGKDSEVATQNFVKVLDKFGVSVTDTGGRLRPAGQILGDFATALKGIPDPATRTAVAMDALGVRGRELAPLLLRDDINFQNLLSTIERSGLIIGGNMKRTLDQGEASLREFRLEVDVAKIKIEQFLANKFFEGVHTAKLGVELVIDPVKAAIDFQSEVRKEFRRTHIDIGDELRRLTPNQSSSGALVSSTQDFYNKQAEGELRAQQAIEAGGKQQLELQKLRKEYEEAIKDKQTEQAAQLLKQVNILQSTIELEKSRAAINERIYRLIGEGHFGGTPKRTPQTPDEIINQILHPGITAPDLGGFPSLPPGGVLGGISGASSGLPPDVLDKIKGVNDEWYNQTASAAQKIQDEYQKNYEYFKTIEDLYPQYAAQINQTLVKLEQDKNKQLADLNSGADKKYEEEAGKLFDDILSGNRKKLGQAIEKDLLEAVSAPLKKVFEQYVGSVFATIANALKIPGAPGATGAPASSSNGGILGGIFRPLFGGLGGKIGPGGTAGWWPGAVGGSGSGVAVPAGQVGIATQTMNVNAGTVNVYGLLGLPGAGPLGSSTGNFFGNLNPFSNNAIAGGIGGYGGPAAGGATGASSGGNVMSSLGPYLGGAAMLGLGLGGRNTTAAIMGASMLAKSALTQLSTSGILSPGVSSALGTIAPALPGVGMFASGVIQGGVGGTLEATAGGAMAGMTLGGPIGAAIGAGVGLISGVVSSLIQGQSFENRVKNDMRNQEYTAPPSETFSFAMGNSIAQTLSTGFNQSGGTFGTYGLPSGTPFSATPITGRLTKQQQRQLLEQQMGLLSNQPFLGFPNEDPFTASGQNSQRVGPTGGQRDSGPTVVHIHAMDSQSFSDFAQRNASTFSKAIVGVASLSSAGFGPTVRRATNLP
jgi:hypothetical protein